MSVELTIRYGTGGITPGGAELVKLPIQTSIWDASSSSESLNAGGGARGLRAMRSLSQCIPGDI